LGGGIAGGIFGHLLQGRVDGVGISGGRGIGRKLGKGFILKGDFRDAPGRFQTLGQLFFG
jgi:hypothetical protein